QSTGDVAEAGVDLEQLRKLSEEYSRAVIADTLREALRMQTWWAHSIANWAKVVSQALQLCVRIFESVSLVAAECLAALGRFADMVNEVLVGSWPWDLAAKADAIADFAREVSD